MKVIGILLTAVLGLAACDEKVEESKRDPGPLAASPSTEQPGESNEQDTIVESEVINFSGLSLLRAANSELFDPNQFSRIVLASKIDPNTTVLFANDGVSLSYGVEGELQPIDHRQQVETPAGLNRQVFTLPDDDFWWVEDNKVSKRKLSAETGPNQLVIHTFDITRLTGDISNKKVLGVTRGALILQLTTNIAIFTVEGDLTSSYEFKPELPEGVTGNLVSAGQTEQGGYWFSTDEGKFALLRLEENVWRWNVADVPMSAVTGTVLSTAAWLSTTDQTALGDAAVLTNEALFSVSGRPIAPASAP